MDSSVYREQIIDLYESPLNYGELTEPDFSYEEDNPLCGDVIRIDVRLDEDQRVAEVAWSGDGCAISQASASLLTEAVQGRSKAEILQMFDQVHEMVTTGRQSEGAGKLAVFAGVHKFPARVKCAILPWHALTAALEGKREPVSTEKEE